MNATNTLLPPRLKKARGNTKMTQRELAQVTGLSQSYIAQVESGDRTPSVETMRALGHALGVSVSWLLGQGVGECSGDDASGAAPEPPRELLADREVPEGLRDLVSDRALVASLRISEAEWRALLSIELPGQASKDGYVNLLFTVRAITGA